MYTYTISVGQPEVTIGVLSLKEVKQHRLNQLPMKSGVEVKPCDTFVMNADGCPVIIATAGQKMMVAHARHAYVVNAIIAALKQGSPIDRISICMQFATEALESACMEQARRVGLYHIWAMHPFSEFPALVRTHQGNDNPDQWSKIMVRRNA